MSRAEQANRGKKKAGKTQGGQVKNGQNKTSQNKNGQNKTGQIKAGQIKTNMARRSALQCLQQVFKGQSLSMAQARHIDQLQDARDRGLANEVANGVLRWRWRLEFIIARLLKKPLKAKDIDVQLLLMMALYELMECRSPDYAVINEAVAMVRKSRKKWAASMVNACLRRYTREREEMAQKLRLAEEEFTEGEQLAYNHPQWMIDRLKQDWPDHWSTILQANNQRPPLWLRVNRRQYSSGQYQQQLAQQSIAVETSELSQQALKLLQGGDVTRLPGFASGSVAVQDAGAQLAAELLNVSGGQRVLDLCAAPGGKTCHVLETHADVDYLQAVELEQHRMSRVSENLQRLQLLPAAQDEATQVELVVADARDYQRWWSGQAFDRILLDAPCSASGVIRRHPDIKTLRRHTDIDALVSLQAEILSAAWQMLAAGGELLYITCSVFKDENERQIASFLASRDDVQESNITADWGVACEFGRQLLPGDGDADGFYYCRLKKNVL